MIYFDSSIRVLDPQSDQAGAISGLIWLTFGIALVVVVMVSVLLIVASLRFRHRTESGDTSEPRQVSGNFKLEVAWTVAPALLLVAMFVVTLGVMNASDPPVPANAASSQPDVEIIGHQWWWEYRYPKENVTTANVMYIPVGQKVLAKLESGDVIHDWWVPQIARKMDNNPGAPNYEYLKVDHEGVWHGYCAEYCGTQHAWMQISVHAVTPAQFATWIQGQQKASNPVVSAINAAPATTTQSASNTGTVQNITADTLEKGKQVFLNNTCVNCHAIAGTNANYANVGPNLTHVGSREIIAAGAVDEPQDDQATALKNMAAWVRNPGTFKPGVHMPAYLQLSDTDLNNLAAYLESLK